MTTFDLDQVDALLSTTRAVRKRLDLDRPVPDDVLLDCVRLSQQAPTGSNSQTWRWLIVRDANTKAGLAELYRTAGSDYLSKAAERTEEGQTKRVYTSALWLVDHLADVPVHVVPCLQQRVEGDSVIAWASAMGSIFPAVWSFQLALRSRGLGSTLTTLHLAFEQQAAELLGIPDDVMQVALLPVAYTKGTDFLVADRPPAEDIVFHDRWGQQH